MTTKTLTKQLQKLEDQILTIRRVVGTVDYSNASVRGAVNAWRRMGGALRHRGRVDTIKWQRKIRSEWDHRERPKDV